jgi:hypothetical protein
MDGDGGSDGGPAVDARADTVDGVEVDRIDPHLTSTHVSPLFAQTGLVGCCLHHFGHCDQLLWAVRTWCSCELVGWLVSVVAAEEMVLAGSAVV